MSYWRMLNVPRWFDTTVEVFKNWNLQNNMCLGESLLLRQSNYEVREFCDKELELYSELFCDVLSAWYQLSDLVIWNWNRMTVF